MIVRVLALAALAITELSSGSSAALERYTPMQADAFIDSIGVNTHLIQDLTADREYALIVQRMQQLGLHHVRDSIYPRQSRKQNEDERRFFAATESNILAITDCPRPLGYYPGSQTPPRVTREFNDATGRHIEYLEGPNEPDLRHVRDWAPLTKQCVAGDDRHQALPVPFVAPAMGNPFNARRLGDISGLVDFGGIHRYFQGHNPGTRGYGPGGECGRFEAIEWNICEARINAGSTAPLYVTETGYSTFGEIDELTLGKYISRVLFVDSLAGIARTYLYELHDDGTDPKNPEDGFGLFRYDGTPKPAFYAVRNIVALLRDPGPAFPPAPLAYGVAGAPSIRHELFQKRNGKYFIAIWNERESWDPRTDREIYVPPATVTLSFDASPSDVEYLALDDGGFLRKQPVQGGGTTLQIQVDDHVGFLSFR